MSKLEISVLLLIIVVLCMPIIAICYSTTPMNSVSGKINYNSRFSGVFKIKDGNRDVYYTSLGGIFVIENKGEKE